MTSLEDQMNPHDAAFGPCAICGRETRGSVYWSGIGPAPALFTPQVNEPFCSAACSTKHADRDLDAEAGESA